MAENTEKTLVAAQQPMSVTLPELQVQMGENISLQTLREVFQEAAQMIQAKDTCLIHNGEIEPDDGITPLRIRKFNEDLYIISGYRLSDPAVSPVSRRLQEYQSNPLAEAIAPGTYQVVVFQHGNRKEQGNNGVTMESLLSICKDRLESFEDSDFACVENARAIECIQQAIDALNARAERRKLEGRYDSQTPEVKQLASENDAVSSGGDELPVAAT